MPIRWTVTYGNILDLTGDVLVCSANIFLNLSGGVGGELLRRCGVQAQEQLHRHLADSGKPFVQPGEVVEGSAFGLPVQAVLHAVAVDGFYKTSPEIVRGVIGKCLGVSASLRARQVLMTALATGYGRLPMRGFAEAIRPVINSEYRPVDEVVICVKNASDQEELTTVLALT